MTLKIKGKTLAPLRELTAISFCLDETVDKCSLLTEQHWITKRTYTQNNEKILEVSLLAGI